MAYFEYDYVNTGYDTDSAEPPVSVEQEAIVNFVYSTFDVVSAKIVNFNYNVFTTIESKIYDFNYDVYSGSVEKIYDFNIDIKDGFVHSGAEFGMSILNPIFIYSRFTGVYNIGDSIDEGALFITRLNEND